MLCPPILERSSIRFVFIAGESKRSEFAAAFHGAGHGYFAGVFDLAAGVDAGGYILVN
jgi:hypothetical protein